MRSLLVVPIIVALGCAGLDQYVYAPETANASQAGLPAARAMIPPERPEGSVQVTSSGVTELSPDHRQVIPVVHVRMTVSNDGDATPWRVDTRNQLLEIPGEGRARALFANSDVRSVPIVTIPPGEQHVIDLFFPLPQGIDAGHLPQFDLVWQVDTAARTVASRTAFDREQEVAADAGYGGPYAYGAPYDYGWYGPWGPYWWYDPYWGSVAWFHPRPIFWGHHPWRPNGVVTGRFNGRFRGGMVHHGAVARGGFHGGQVHSGGHGGHGGHR